MFTLVMLIIVVIAGIFIIDQCKSFKLFKQVVDKMKAQSKELDELFDLLADEYYYNELRTYEQKCEALKLRDLVLDTHYAILLNFKSNAPASKIEEVDEKIKELSQKINEFRERIEKENVGLTKTTELN